MSAWRLEYYVAHIWLLSYFANSWKSIISNPRYSQLVHGSGLSHIQREHAVVVLKHCHMVDTMHRELTSWPS